MLDRFAAAAIVAIASSTATAAPCSLPNRAWDQAPRFSPPASGPVTKKFGMIHDPLLNVAKMHTGIDYKGQIGDAVMAAAAGRVVEANHNGADGNFVLLDHGGRIVTAYAHLNRIEVKEGTCVAAGERIGEEGSTGLSTGPHLHFEVRRDGRPVDPEPMLGGSGR